MSNASTPGAGDFPEPDCWIFGDLTVDENGSPHTYRYSMLLSFKSVEDFRAARAVIYPLIDRESSAGEPR